MSKDPLIILQHILECIEKIEKYTKNCSKERFIKNEMLHDAVIKKLEVIGVEVKQLMIDFTSKYPQVEWSDLARTRDKLAHNYFGIDLGITFTIIEDDLPLLKEKIVKIIKDLKKNIK